MYSIHVNFLNLLNNVNNAYNKCAAADSFYDDSHDDNVGNIYRLLLKKITDTLSVG